MPASTYKLILLPLIVCYLLAILCATTATVIGGCDCSTRDRFLIGHSWRCSSRPIFYRGRGPYDYEGRCRTDLQIEDCLLPQFQCVGNFRCVPRRHVCNGIPDCSDGSDEWRCISHTTTTASTVSTTTSRMFSESTEHTFSYPISTSTMLRDNEEKATRDTFPESRDNTFSTSTTESMIPAYSEPNNVLSTSTTPEITMSPHSESNTTFFSSTTSTIIPNSESSIATSSSTTTKTMITQTEPKTAQTPSPYTVKIESESNTTASSFTTTSTMIPDSESKTAPSSSTTSTVIPDNESNPVTSNPTTTKTMHSVSEENSSISTFAAHNTMVPESVEKTLPSTTNNIFPESSEMLSCPDNYCMQNAECIVVKGQYRCKCPSSSIGELCEIKLGTEQSSIQYTVAIALSMAFVVLCLVATLVCIYRYKRLSSWKSRDMTSRTLSQMTLTSNAVE